MEASTKKKRKRKRQNRKKVGVELGCVTLPSFDHVDHIKSYSSAAP